MRELKNLIERIVQVELPEAEHEILPEHLPPELTGTAPRPAGGGAGDTASPFRSGVVLPLAEVEKMAIVHAIAVCGGNKTRAAMRLGISRQTLRTKLKEFAMEDVADDEGEPQG